MADGDLLDVVDVLELSRGGDRERRVAGEDGVTADHRAAQTATGRA